MSMCRSCDTVCLHNDTPPCTCRQDRETAEIISRAAISVSRVPVFQCEQEPSNYLWTCILHLCLLSFEETQSHGLLYTQFCRHTASVALGVAKQRPKAWMDQASNTGKQAGRHTPSHFCERACSANWPDPGLSWRHTDRSRPGPGKPQLGTKSCSPAQRWCHQRQNPHCTLFLSLIDLHEATWQETTTLYHTCATYVVLTRHRHHQATVF